MSSSLAAEYEVQLARAWHYDREYRGFPCYRNTTLEKEARERIYRLVVLDKLLRGANIEHEKLPTFLCVWSKL